MVDGPNDKGGVDLDARTRTADGLSHTVETGENAPVEALRSQSQTPWPVPDFGARYGELVEIARGGMGEVYRAYDRELVRQVALKVIRPERIDREENVERFRREIALASKVTHKNVLRVYDLGEHGATRFLSMQYVDGDNLATIMRKSRPLPLARALGLFRQICEGLLAAHEEGVVHRDLKPHNVLVDRKDNVYVADFGLARSLEDATVTVTGARLGSPAYMSPEQVKGDPLDQRSDIYSLGVILYQLLAGRLPFEGSSAHSIMEQRLHRKPPPVRGSNPAVPAFLEGILARCLAVEPADRYASLRDLLGDLDAARAPPPRKASSRRWVLACLSVAVLGGVVGAAIWRANRGGTELSSATPRAPASSAAPAPPDASKLVTVLILDIDNRTGDPVFDGTLDEVLRCALSRSLRLDPIARHDLRQLAAELDPEPQPLDERLGQKLALRDGRRVVNVRGVLGSRGAGVAVSITARDATTGAAVLTRTVEAPSASRVVATLGLLATDLRRELGDDAAADPQRAEQTGMSASLEADHEFAVARGLHEAGKDEEAIVHLEKATEIDPTFAEAHALLAMSFLNVQKTSRAGEELKLALKWIDSMSERDGLKFLGDYYSFTAGEHDRGIAAYKSLLEKWPGDLHAETNLAFAYELDRQMKNAVEVGARTAHEHPRDVIARAGLVSSEVVSGDFEGAVREGGRALEEFANPMQSVYADLAIADLLLSRREDAVSVYGKLRAVDEPGAAQGLADLAMAEGRLADANRLLEQAVLADSAKSNARASVEWAMVAELRLRTGDKRGALLAATKAMAGAAPTQRMAAAVAIAAGDEKGALDVATRLSQDLAPDPRAYAKWVRAEALRVRGKAKEAAIAFEESLQTSDTWAGHYGLARAYLDAGAFAEARDELKTCLARRGEGAMIALDDVPSYRYVPPVLYYLARAQEGLGTPDVAEAYRTFLALAAPAVPGERDPLVDDARRRLDTNR